MFAMFGLLLALGVVSVQAQPGDLIEVKVPFDFQISGKTLPAGEYTVKRLSDKAMQIRSGDGRVSAIAQAPTRVQAEVIGKEAKAGLVFHQYGEQYFLSQIWMTKDGDGQELNRTNDEGRAAGQQQNLAANGKRLRRVEIEAHAR